MAAKLTNFLLLALIAAVFFLGAMLVEEQRRTRRMLADVLDRLPAADSTANASASAVAPGREPAAPTPSAPSAGQSSAASPSDAPASPPSLLTLNDHRDGDRLVPQLARAELPGHNPGSAIASQPSSSPRGEVPTMTMTDTSPAASPTPESAHSPPPSKPAASPRQDRTESPFTKSPERDASPDRDTASASAPASKPIDPPSSDDRGDSSSPWPRFEPTIERTLRDLFAGQYEAAVERFGPGLRASLGPDKLAAFMDRLAADRGRFVRILDHHVPDVRLPAGLHAFKVTFQTDRGEPLTFTFTLNRDQRITGLFPR